MLRVVSLFVFIHLLSCLSVVSVLGQPSTSKYPYTYRGVMYDVLDANAITYFCGNDGSLAYDPMYGLGLGWPRAGWPSLMYSEGFVIGGIDDNGRLRVAGSAQSVSSFQPGPILADGRAADPEDPRYRIYKAKRLTRQQFEALASEEQYRLRTDFHEWPADLGAPFHDADNDGIYTPDFDSFLDGDDATDTPLFPGSVVLWFVSNDLDPARTSKFFGSDPFGIEMHTLLWASPGDTVGNNTVFVQHTIINKSSSTLRDAYIGRYADPEMVDSFNDRVGTDSAAAMTYAYNVRAWSEYHADPPAITNVWLQTPIVPSSGDVAWYNFKRRDAYRNLPLHAASYFAQYGLNPTPVIHSSADSSKLYAALAGMRTNGMPFIDPHTSAPTNFVFSGDPARGEGWLDDVPGDKHMISSAGPLTFAPGDTQQVVIATTIGQGYDHHNSVRELRVNARVLHTSFAATRAPQSILPMKSSLMFAPDGNVTLSVTAECVDATSMEAVLQAENGDELARFMMYDDGNHDDEDADDGIFGASFSSSTFPRGADLYLQAQGSDGEYAIRYVWYKLPLPGHIELSSGAIVSDNLNFDGTANPGEHVRIDVELRNTGRHDLGVFRLKARSDVADPTLAWINQVVPPGESARSSASATFLQVLVPEDATPGDDLRIPVWVTGDQYCVWPLILSLPIVAATDTAMFGEMLHVRGNAYGTLGWKLMDETALKPHLYRVNVLGEDYTQRTFEVIDESEQRELLTGIPIPDSWGHDGPIIDGWRLNMGSAIDSIIHTASGSPNATEPLPIFHFSTPERAWIVPRREGAFAHAITTIRQGLDVYDCFPVALVFDRHHGQLAYSYDYGREDSFAYVGYFPIPVRAYDLRNPDEPRQLTLCFTELYGGVANDSTWFPTTDYTDLEQLFIADHDYSITPEPVFETRLNEQGLRLMYRLFGVLDTTRDMFLDGDSLLITPRVPISKRDSYVLDFTGLTSSNNVATPARFALHGNHPNPWNPSTAVHYEIPRAGRVRLTLHDSMGRELRVLLDAERDAGMHVYHLLAGNLPSGVYFLRLQSASMIASSPTVLIK